MENKRFLKIFSSQNDYESQKDSVMGMPHVVLLEDTNEVVYASENNEDEGTTSYEMVDLGLPSGIKWANMNVGATSESDFGLFFQWGDTVGYTSDQCGTGEGQKSFSWSDYKWCNGGYNTMTKYCTSSSYGTVDGKTVLDAEDDGVRVHMGGDWRLPTGTNMEELIANTTYEYATIDGVAGGKFTNKTDSSKYIFLPGAACSDGSFGLGTSALSWSSSLDESYSGNALCLGGDSCGSGVSNLSRYYGLPLRGVVG